MKQDSIEDLHQRATSHYLRGDFAEALESWRQILSIDPDDARALEGVRLAGLLGSGGAATGPDATAAPAPVPDARRRLDEIEARIEAGDLHGALRSAEVLREEIPEDADVLSALARAHAAIGNASEAADVCAQVLSLDPSYAEAAALLRQCRDVGSPETELGVLVLREPSPRAHAAEAANPASTSPRAVARPDAEPPLDAIGAPAEEDEDDSAATVLAARVQDLLTEARRAEAAGRPDEALDVLSRLLILDEQNEEALALEQRLRGEVDSTLSDTGDDPLEEDLEIRSERGDAAAPRTASALLDPTGAEAEFFEVAEDPAPPVPRPAPVEAAAKAPPRPRRRIALPSIAWKPSPKILAIAAAGLIVLSGGLFAAKQFWIDPAEAEAVAPPPATSPSSVVESATPASAPPAVPASTTPLSEPAGTAPGPPSPAQRLREALARGHALFEEGNYGAAVIAFNDALEIDPNNVAAKAGLSEAGEKYRRSQTEDEKLARARKSFADGAYETSLRLLYRLPDGLIEPKRMDRYRVNGWYNLGLVALRAADCASAASHFQEAMLIQSSDPAVLEAAKIAARCPDVPKDRAFYDQVERLGFRGLED